MPCLMISRTPHLGPNLNHHSVRALPGFRLPMVISTSQIDIQWYTGNIDCFSIHMSTGVGHKDVITESLSYSVWPLRCGHCLLKHSCNFQALLLREVLRILLEPEVQEIYSMPPKPPQKSLEISNNSQSVFKTQSHHQPGSSCQLLPGSQWLQNRPSVRKKICTERWRFPISI